MNQSQALTEARRRWGKAALLRKERDGSRSVGVLVLGLMFEVRGTGKTWAEAFANVDEQAHREHLMFGSYGQPCAQCSCTMVSPRSLPTEGEPLTLDHIVCNSCFLNTKLPARFRGWPERRREALWQATYRLHWWLVVLGQGKVPSIRQTERDLERVLTIALTRTKAR